MLDEFDIKNLKKSKSPTIPVSIMSPDQKRSYKVLQSCGWVEPMNYCGTGRTCFQITKEGEEQLLMAEATA